MEDIEADTWKFIDTIMENLSVYKAADAGKNYAKKPGE